MTVVDLLALACVALVAVQGAFRGLSAQLLSLAGLAGGALAGSRLAPRALPDAELSPWLPVATLAAALVGALVLGAVAGSLATVVRRSLLVRPALRLADAAGGTAVGAALGLGLAWLVAVVALHQPALGLRPPVQRSVLLPALVRAVPPEPVLGALARFDPLPLLRGLPGPRLPPPDAAVLRSPGVRAAADSVVKVVGTSCGIGVQGSGWTVRPGVVATNAHVVAGQDETHVLARDGRRVPAEVVYVDAGNDVALLRARGLRTAPLAVDAGASFPRRVALLGYPGNRALVAAPATAGPPRSVVAPDAYERRARLRVVVPLRGHVERGASGGPAVDRRGRVVAMIFGGARGNGGALGVPVRLVLRGLAAPLRPVSPGPCIA